MAHFFTRRAAPSALLVSLLWISATEAADTPAAQPTTLRLIPLGQKSTADPDSEPQVDADNAETPAPEVVSPETVSHDDSPPAPISRPCVLLRNHNVLFGDAVQKGEQILIRRDDGSEIRLPRTQVACWAKSLRDLYQYRLDHRRGGDLAVHLRDARWCLRYELLDLAAEEIRSVYTLDPSNSEAKLIESQIRHLASAQATKRAEIQSVGYEQVTPQGEDEPSDAVAESGNEIDANWLRHFAGHVQPTLINRCGQCHAEASDRAWRLLLPPIGTRASARMTTENLAATMPYVDTEFPSKSELLRMATAAHGGVPAPLGLRNATALDALKKWLQAVPADRSDSQTTDRQDIGWDRPDSQPSFAANITKRFQKPATEVEPEQRDLKTANDQPSRLPQVANPFDPDLFNRRFHPAGRD